MKLIDLLVQELPKRGGWPEGADECYWHSGFSNVCFYNDGSDVDGSPELATNGLSYNGDDDGESVSRKQYESALATSKAVVGHDGWIQWAGGERPVDSDAIVEVKYRKPSPYQFNNGRAGDFNWLHDGFGGYIIAYRLHKPHESSKSDDEADLNECIGQDVATVWSGEGKPAIGEKCEHHSGGQWEVVTIAGIYENLVTGFTDYWMVKEDGSSYTVGNPYRFRPIRSEADKKRDEAVQALCDAGGGNGKVDEMAGYGSCWFDVYDAIAAGKVRGVKLED